MQTDLLKNELLSDRVPLRVLLLLSGGKDSICCLYNLIDMGIENLYLEALFMKHKWSSLLSYEEARRHSSICGVKLNVIDFSDVLQKKIDLFSNGRPCLICKRTMYEFAIKFAVQNEFNWIATGDSKSDTTTCARLADFNKENRDNRFFCSKYLAGEQGLSLPNGISVVRPLLDKNSDEIEEELKNKKKFVKRNYSTGDKYFDYSREGCCLQFCDPGTKITTDIADKLYLYNDIANNWGRNHKIRTSVHLPSTFVVTIPCGYEDNVISDLREHGLFVDFDCNSPLQKNNYLSIAIEHYPDKSFSADIFLFLMRRFSERLGIKEDSQSSAKIFCAKNDNITLSAHFLCNALVLSIQYQSHDKITFCNRLYHLCIEVFHTRAISINGKSIDRGDVLRDPLFI